MSDALPPFDLPALQARVTEQLLRLLSGLPNLAVALLLVALAWWLGRWLAGRGWLRRAGTGNPFLRELGQTTVRWVVTGLGVVVALEVMNATALVGAMLGTAGVLGVALGFAFKDTLENYLAGILMGLRQPFAPRDHLVIDGNEGIVVAMNARATILMTPDGNHLRLPNALVFRSVTLNYTRNPSRRFAFTVGIGVQEDLLRAQQIGLDEMAAIDGVLTEPPPRAFIDALGDSNVQMRYLAWVDQRSHDFNAVRSEAIRRVKLALEDADMDMPEPIYRVQLTPQAPAPHPAQGSAEHGDGLTRPRSASTAPAARSRAAAAPAPPPSTRAQNDLAPQISAEERGRGGTDLLDPAAPRE